MKSLLGQVFVLGLLIAQANPYGAVVQNPTVTGLNNNSGGGMYIDPIAGYDFTPTQAFPIDYLGVYDDRSNGLSGNHSVGLFIRQTGQMLAIAIVHNGSLFENMFRWERIPRITLQPGVVYNLSAFNQREDSVFADWAVNLNINPNITGIQGYIEGDQPSFHMPTRQGGPGAMFLGPAFGTAVPEPTTVGLIVGGLVLITMRKLRANRPTCESQRAQIVNNFLRG